MFRENEGINNGLVAADIKTMEGENCRVVSCYTIEGVNDDGDLVHHSLYSLENDQLIDIRLNLGKVGASN